MSRVCILILNWNSWPDTLECLESVFRNTHHPYQVVVCDNGSDDGSLERIREWSAGQIECSSPPGHCCHGFTFPPVAKPIACVEYDRPQAEAGGNASAADIPLVLVQNGDNLGFAGGNNVGLRYVLCSGGFDHVWLLNNDTVIKPDALACLVRRMEQSPQAGMCGSTIPYYHEPHLLWAAGGAVYNPWLARSRNMGVYQPVESHLRYRGLERQIDYVVGASLLASSAFLRDVGLLCEDYFLYFEELDWARRGRSRYGLVYAPDSLVYHKVGASTGLGRTRRRENPALENLMLRNKLLITRRFFPYALPLAAPMVALEYCQVHIASALRRMARRGMSTVARWPAENPARARLRPR